MQSKRKQTISDTTKFTLEWCADNKYWLKKYSLFAPVFSPVGTREEAVKIVSEKSGRTAKKRVVAGAKFGQSAETFLRDFYLPNCAGNCKGHSDNSDTAQRKKRVAIHVKSGRKRRGKYASAKCAGSAGEVLYDGCVRCADSGGKCL